MRIPFFSRKKTKVKQAKEVEKSYNIPVKNLRDIRDVLYTSGWENVNIGYEGHYIIFRAIELMSTMIASLDFNIMRGEKKLPPDTPLKNGFNLLYPNPNASFNELMHFGLIDLFDKGKMFLYLNDANFLERLPAKLMQLKNGIWSLRQGGKSIQLEQDNIVYIPYGIDGKSPIQLLKEDITSDKRASVFNKVLMENFGQTGDTYETSDETSDDAIQQWIKEVDKYHNGVDNAGKRMILPKGVKRSTQGKNLKDMQFVEIRNEIRDRALIMFGIHKALVGVTDQVNRSVSEEATRQLWQTNLLPLSKRIQEKFNQQLFRKNFPQYIMKYDYSNIESLQDNYDNKLISAQKLQALGYTMNEINQRLDLGMEDVKGIGDTRLFQSTLITADDILLPAILPNREKTVKEDKLDTLVKYLENESKIEEKAVNPRRIKVKVDRILNRYERVFRKTMKSYFSKQLIEVMKIVKNEKKAYEDTLLIDIKELLEKEKERLGEVTKPLYEDISKVADQFGIDVMGLHIAGKTNSQIVDEMVFQIKGNINKVTYKGLRNLFKTSIEQGMPRNEIAKNIRKFYGFSAGRSKVIAQTETSNVFNRSAISRYDVEGVEKIQWVSTNDGKTRDSHRINEIINRGETFSNGLQYPGDPNGPAEEVVNCRCTVAPVILED